MKKTLAALAVLAVSVVSFATNHARAADVWKATIQSTGTSTVSGWVAANDQYMLQCDAAAYYRTCATVSCTAVATDAKISAGEAFDVVMPREHEYLAIISVSGTANCQLFSVIPKTAGARRGLRGGTGTPAAGTNTGDVTLAAVGSSANANGATLTGQVLNLQPYSSTQPGVTTTGTQTAAGTKNFTGYVYAANALRVASNGSSGALSLEVNATSPTYALTVQYDNGRVGIGTNAPSVPLDVVGAIVSSTNITADQFITTDGPSIFASTSTKMVTGGGTTIFGAPAFAHSSSNAAAVVYGSMNDGATADGVILDTTQALSTSGANLVSFRNNGTEKSFIDKDGAFSGLLLQTQQTSSPGAPGAGDVKGFIKKLGAPINVSAWPGGEEVAGLPLIGLGTASYGWRIGLTGSTDEYQMATATATGTNAAIVATGAGWIAQSAWTEKFSSSAAGSSAGLRQAANPAAYRGNAAGLGGFLVWTRVAIQTTVATQRSLIGLVSTSADIANTEPSAQVDCVFAGNDTADANLSVMHNDATGTATKVDLGASFPAQTAGAVYDIYIYSAPNGSTIEYAVQRLDSAAFTTGTLSTNLPTNTVLLYIQTHINNGATAATTRLYHGPFWVWKTY